MRNFFFYLICGLTFTTCLAQTSSTITDSCIVRNHKFVLSQNNGIAEIQAFLGEQEVPVKKTIKMHGPVYFLMENGTADTLLEDDLLAPNGDSATVFAIVGNEAHPCQREGRNLKNLDDFCGTSVQGVIISADGITLTDYMLEGLTCIRENAVGLKDLYGFAEMELTPEE